MPWQNPGGQAVQRRLEAFNQDFGPVSPRSAGNAALDTGRFMISPLDCSSILSSNMEPCNLSPPCGQRVPATGRTNCNTSSMDTAMQRIGAAVESLVEALPSTASKQRNSQPTPKGSSKEVSFVRKESRGVSHMTTCTSPCARTSPPAGTGSRVANWKAGEPRPQLCHSSSGEQKATTCQFDELAVLQNQAPEGPCTSPGHRISQCSSLPGTAWAVPPSSRCAVDRLYAWRCFLVVPVAAAVFAVTVGARRWGRWEQVEPGVQVMTLTSWLQCCWFVMSRDGRRITVRLAQLAAAGLGLLLVLLPLLSDVYGSQLQPGALDEQVDSGLIVPDMAALWSALGHAVVGGRAGAATADVQHKAGYESLEDADRRRSLVHLQAALASLLAIWLLQVLTAIFTPPPPAAPPHNSPLLLGSLKSHADLASLYGEDLHHPNNEEPAGIGSGRGCCPAVPPTSSLPQLALGLQPGQVLRGPAQVAQWALLVGAVVAQSAVAVEVVELQRPALERLQLGSGTATSSIHHVPTSTATSPARIQPLTAISISTANWPALSILALAMSVPLPLPSLLSAAAAAPTSIRARLLLHPALLQLRPAAAGRRLLGLQLADGNVPRLLTALAVGVLMGPPAGAFTWQLLQVATVVMGMGALWLAGIRPRPSLLIAQQQHAVGGGGGYSSLGTVFGYGISADCTQLNGVAAGPGAAATAADSWGGMVSFSDVPGTHGAPGRAACGTAAVAVGNSGSWRPGGREGDVTVLDGGPLRVTGADGSGPDGPLTSPSCGPGSSGGCSGPTVLSPCSSGRSLASGSTDAVGALHFAGGGAGVSPACSSWSAAAVLGRRPPAPAPVSGPTDLPLDSPQHQHHHRHAGTADGAFSTHKPSPVILPLSPCRASRLPGGRASSTSPCLATSRAALARWLGCVCAAVKPWHLLIGSLGTLTALLWLALMAPPLAVMGDGPSDVFEGLMETGPGSVLVLALLAGAVSAGLLAAGCLVWCATTGELWRRWRFDAWERRRLECLAWACGPQVLVAAFSALSWALGEEHNTGAFMLAEALRLAALWPLVWLMEPWLLMPGRVPVPVGGCMQHAGCGVTCCVLRWCGLRSNSSAVSGGRRDVVQTMWDCEGQAAGRWSMGRRGAHGTNLRVEVN